MQHTSLDTATPSSSTPTRRFDRSSRSRTARLTALAAVGALAFAACGGDDEGAIDDANNTPGTDDVTPDDGIALLAGGNAEKYEVAPKYAVGQQAKTVMDMNLSLSGAGESVSVGLEMDMEQRVTAHDEDSTTVEMKITGVEVTDAPAGAETSMDAVIGRIVGQALVAEYDENGQQIGEVKMKSGQDIPAEFKESFGNQSQAVFPTEEIGVGSRWSQVIKTESNGIELEFTTVYELSEVTAEEFVVIVTQEAPIDTEVSGADLKGHLKASGEVRMDRANPLMINGTYGLDMSAEADGQSLDVGLDLELASS